MVSIKSVIVAVATFLAFVDAAPMSKRWIGAPPCSSDPSTNGNQGCISPQDDAMAYNKYLECQSGQFVVRSLAAGTVCQGVDGYRVIGVFPTQGCSMGQQRCKEPGNVNWNYYEECDANGVWQTRQLAPGTACQALPGYKVFGVMPGSAPL